MDPDDKIVAIICATLIGVVSMFTLADSLPVVTGVVGMLGGVAVGKNMQK